MGGEDGRVDEKDEDGGRRGFQEDLQLLLYSVYCFLMLHTPGSSLLDSVGMTSVLFYGIFD